MLTVILVFYDLASPFELTKKAALHDHRTACYFNELLLNLYVLYDAFHATSIVQH